MTDSKFNAAAETAEAQEGTHRVFLFAPSLSGLSVVETDGLFGIQLHQDPILREQARIAIIRHPDGYQQRFSYTAMGDIPADASEEQAKQVHGAREAEIVWRGPAEAVIYCGPTKNAPAPDQRNLCP